MQIYNQVKHFVYKNKIKILILVTLVFIFFLSTLFFLKLKNNQKDVVVYENIIEEKNISKKVESKEYYYIDIKGYVNNPGVYSLEKGKRVVDAINIAGGLKKDANTSLLNLSLELTDQMVIIVYSNAEINDFLNKEKQVEQESKICNETIKNDACIINNENKEIEPVLDEDNNSIVKNEEDIKEENLENKEEFSKININTATKEELMTLNKIGEVKATAIIDYRKKNGFFKKIEDIKNVSGIGDTLFAEIKDNITV